jgi:hypothetical protein
MKQLSMTVMALGLTVGWNCQADGAKVIKSRTGNCQVSVPADWSAGELRAMADSPDKKTSVVVSSPKSIDSFSELKQNAKLVYTKSKVTKDSSTEFEMEGESTAGVPDAYRAVPIAGNKFCIAEATYKTGDATQAKGIVATLQAAK